MLWTQACKCDDVPWFIQGSSEFLYQDGYNNDTALETSQRNLMNLISNLMGMVCKILEMLDNCTAICFVPE